jgi:hypothetical protein
VESKVYAEDVHLVPFLSKGNLHRLTGLSNGVDIGIAGTRMAGSQYLLDVSLMYRNTPVVNFDISDAEIEYECHQTNSKNKCGVTYLNQPSTLRRHNDTCHDERHRSTMN